MPAGAVGGERSRLPAARRPRDRHDRGAQRPGRHRRRQDRRLPADPLHRRPRADRHPGPLLLRSAGRRHRRRPDGQVHGLGKHARHGRLPAEGRRLRPDLGAERPPRLERQRGQEPGDLRERVQRRDDVQLPTGRPSSTVAPPAPTSRARSSPASGRSSSASPTSRPIPPPTRTGSTTTCRYCRATTRPGATTPTPRAARRRRRSTRPPAGTPATCTCTARWSRATRP